MSRENRPTDNAVAARFMPTFKEHQIAVSTFEQAIQEFIISGAKPCRTILNIFIQSLNNRTNKKTLLKNPERQHKDVLAASLLIP